jgi:hypothetical protein
MEDAMADDKNVLSDKQKFGQHREEGQLQHGAEEKLKHMGEECTPKAKPPGPEKSSKAT